MKKIINLISTVILLISFFFVKFLSAVPIFDNNASNTEIYFSNNSSLHDISVTVFPVSAVYTVKNNFPNNGQFQFKYTLLGETPEFYLSPQNIYYRFDYINLIRYETENGSTVKKNSIIIPYPLQGGGGGYNFDPSNSGTNNANYGIYGVGIYKIVFTWDGGSDYCYYEQDANGYPNQLYFNDLIFGFDNYNETVRVKYIFDDIVPYVNCGNIPPDPVIPISSVNRYIKTWKPYPVSFCNWSRAKNYGGFDYRSDESNYSKFPLDPRQDCNLTIIPTLYRNQNQTDGEDNTYGKITLNTTLKKDLVTPISGNINDIIILNDADDGNGPVLKIFNSNTLTLKQFTGHTYGTYLRHKSNGNTPCKTLA